MRLRRFAKSLQVAEELVIKTDHLISVDSMILNSLLAMMEKADYICCIQFFWLEEDAGYNSRA